MVEQKKKKKLKKEVGKKTGKVKAGAAKQKVKKKGVTKSPGKKTVKGTAGKGVRLPDKRKAKRDLEKKAKEVSDRDISELMERRKDIEDKLKKVPGAFGKLINQIKLLLEMVRDYRIGAYRDIPWYSIAMAVASVLYFVNPFDIIPDIIPLLGYVDDAFVIGLGVMSIREDLKKYCAFKGYDPAQYF